MRLWKTLLPGDLTNSMRELAVVPAMARILLILVVALVAAPEPVSAKGKRKGGCFSGSPVVASTAYLRLWKYAANLVVWDGESQIPSTTYGRCTVDDAIIRDPKGKMIARLHCGIEVTARGMVDHLGVSVGAKGSEVLERSQKGELLCSSYTGGSRCFLSEEEDPAAMDAGSAFGTTASYIVGRSLPDGEALRGEEAALFFAPQRIKSFTMLMSCH